MIDSLTSIDMKGGGGRGDCSVGGLGRNYKTRAKVETIVELQVKIMYEQCNNEQCNDNLMFCYFLALTLGRTQS